MSKIDQYSRRIASYIYGDMEPGENAEFEKDLLTDEELAKEYRMQSTAVDFLKSKVVLED